jgi:hypothetical protein
MPRVSLDILLDTGGPMAARSLVLAALALLLAEGTSAAPAAAPTSSLLAIAGDDVADQPSSGSVRLVRSRSTNTPLGTLETQYEVFALIEPSAARAERVIAAAGPSQPTPASGWEWVGSITVTEVPGDQLVGGGDVAARPASAERSATANEPARAPLELALGSVRPNPASARSLVAEFTLANDMPARLELLDVMGRVAASREVGSLGPGRHSLALSDGLHLAPGVYLLRLSQGSVVRVTRAALLE